MSSWQRVLIGLMFIVITSSGEFRPVLEGLSTSPHLASMRASTSRSLPPEREISLIRISGGVDDGCYAVGVDSWSVRPLC
jgi:hypothetical protein